MGGTQGKVKERGDAPEVYDLDNYDPRYHRSHPVKYSLQKSRRRDRLIGSTMSAPLIKSHHNKILTHSETLAVGTTTRQPQQQKLQSQQQQRKRKEQIVTTIKINPNSIKGEQQQEIMTLPSPSIIAPKIRLQILSPVHSRHRERMQEDTLEIPCSSSVDLKPGTDTKPVESEDTKEDSKHCPEENDEDTNCPSTSEYIQPSSPPSNKLIPIYCSPRMGHQINRNQIIMRPPITRTQIHSNVIPKRYSIQGTLETSNSSIKIPQIQPTILPTKSREPLTSTCQSDSKKKLKVKGLRNFIDSHCRTFPPLWAKQFPCRSKFHPDNYLYDFEGSNAPKRPTNMMDKCSKKCGRCNRCGIYVDNVCSKCSRCSHDCNCSSTTKTSPSSNSSPTSNNFTPTAEHFVSQLFGPNWSQTQKVKVNDIPVEPDRPKLNLHECSHNNPLKIGNEETNSKPVLATGYDSYTPVPEQSPLPGYPPPYGGYMYPSYPYSMPYYPTPYMLIPAPTPFYGYGQPPLPVPNPNYSSYQAAVTK